MSFLPILERELRVASRRRTTFLIRSGVGLVAMGLAALGLFTASLGGSAAGQGVFTLLSGYVFLLALAGGVLITADSLSAEKRDGTLGLLFLTDLKGYDVVLGKFGGRALHAIYGLVAVFPALGLPLLTGGVTGAEFWRVSVALLNLLFVSLCVGMVVSAFGRQSSHVFWLTLVALLILVVALPAGLSLTVRLGANPMIERIDWINPAHAYAQGQHASSRDAAREFWLSVGASHAGGWLCLAFAALVLPGSWQDTGARCVRRSLLSRLLGDRVAQIFRARRPRAWLDRRPVLWLMGERPVLRILLWVVAGSWSLGVVLGCLFLGSREAASAVFGVSFFILVGFGLALIEHTCRFWVEARQNGSLEVLLSIPTGSREILAAHWVSIRKHFLWPLLTVLVAGTIPSWSLVWSGILKGDSGIQDFGERLFMHAYLGVMVAWFLATFVAIGYTGVWFALRLKRPQYAVGLTFLCVCVLPTMLCWLGLGVTLVFIVLPMSLLQTNLRGMILQQYAPGSGASSGVRQ